MNARGTRRPHPRRVRPKKVKVSRRAGKSSSGCVLIVAFMLASPLLVFGALVVGAR